MSNKTVVIFTPVDNISAEKNTDKKTAILQDEIDALKRDLQYILSTLEQRIGG